MKILVIGGTRFFGIPMIEDLLNKGHEVTIATRGKTADSFMDRVNRITLDCTIPESMDFLKEMYFDVVIHKVAYCSNDIKYILDRVKCNKFILMSTASVYPKFHLDMKEEEFIERSYPLIWCNRADFNYGEIKRHAEAALAQKYNNRSWTAVRMPYVIGIHDYTKRLYYYVEHIIKGIPMNINNLDSQIGFIDEEQAGRFLSFLADTPCEGAYNASAKGTKSIREIIEYVEKKTGCKAIIDDTAESAPYNGTPDFSVNVDKAKSLGFSFNHLDEWLYNLLDRYIDSCK